MWTLATRDILAEVNEALCSPSQASATQSLGGLSPKADSTVRPSRSWEQMFSPASWEWGLAVMFKLLPTSPQCLGIYLTFPGLRWECSPSFICSTKPSSFARCQVSLSYALMLPRPHSLTLLLLQFLTTNTCSISSEWNLGSWVFFSSQVERCNHIKRYWNKEAIWPSQNSGMKLERKASLMEQMSLQVLVDRARTHCWWPWGPTTVPAMLGTLNAC